MKKREAFAFAPATVANVAVGFDILGFAVSGIGEIAKVKIIENSNEVIVNPVKGYLNIPTNPLKNTASAGLVRLIKEKKLDFGFSVTLLKEISIGSGLGGSSTSAVASLVAVNSLLKKKLSDEELLDYALTGEEVASGARHGDNIAPCLKGGLVFVPATDLLHPIKIKTPKNLRCVLLTPELSIKTKEARKILKKNIPLKSMIQQTANLAGFILGCTNKDINLIQSSLKDVIIEPQRATLVPHFYEIQAAALKAGALGCSLSGSGPTIFALANGQKAAEKILKAMKEVFLLKKMKSKGCWISTISSRGAHEIYFNKR